MSRRRSRDVPTTITAAAVQSALDTFDWAKWRAELRQRYAAWYVDVVAEDGAKTAEQLGGAWRNDDPFVTRFADRYVAERVTQLEDTTREDLRVTITSLFDRADTDGTAVSLTGIAEALGERFTHFSTTRAASIARNETAIAQNHGAGVGYLASGYNYVEISDGDGDAECAAADGQIWSVAYWLANPIEHPNCERSGSPISDEDADALGVDQE